VIIINGLFCGCSKTDHSLGEKVFGAFAICILKIDTQEKGTKDNKKKRTLMMFKDRRCRRV